MKILTVVGARPQLIKAAAFSSEVAKCSWMDEVIIHTGQHFDHNMSDVFFEKLGIPAPKYNLGINSGSHGEMTGRMLADLEKVCKTEKPDGVLVYGDTNSTLAGALAAVKVHIPVFHVEAGLRSFNKRMPEEINRIVTDRISDLLFCPTSSALLNLRNEGVSKNAFVTGDIMHDSVRMFSQVAEQTSLALERLELTKKAFIFSTIHRAENTDCSETLKNIFKGLDRVSRDLFHVVLALHPRTRKSLEKFNLMHLLDNILVTDPLDYLDTLNLITNACMVITDSGGIQKEAYLSKTLCVTVRNETEWVETVKSGWNCLSAPSIETIFESVKEFEMPDAHPEFYGDGFSSKKIINHIAEFIKA